MKRLFYAIALLFVLGAFSSCEDFAERAEIENQENQINAFDTGHEGVGDTQEEPEEETGA